MKAHVLLPWQKLIGKLLDIKVVYNQETISMTISGVNYILPSFLKVLKSRLLKSATIGILRTENGHAIKTIKRPTCLNVANDTRVFHEEHYHQRKSNNETIWIASPDLEQFSEQIKSEESETKLASVYLSVKKGVPLRKGSSNCEALLQARGLAEIEPFLRE
ncbi:MAG: hypothetical protein DRN92_06520 [Thermoproteota archaeon]|nr:MAG: hypothetical protein DRN92_06520 [Candidatus Korarchaeota archaeon]